MPLPRSIARFNRRYTDRFAVRLLRRTHGFTFIGHTGRKTGTVYRTAVYTFAGSDDQLLVSLTYGPSADWAQNVLANGGTMQRAGAAREKIDTAEVVGRESAWTHLPVFVRGALRIFGVHDFMLLTRT